MSRKSYRGLLSEGKKSEERFMLGVDVGDHSSALAYFDAVRGLPETLDISGGYGKPTMPTAMRLTGDSGEWVFGEYALTAGSGENDVVISGLMKKLGQVEGFDINGRAAGVSELLPRFLRELAANCRGINPKAEIAAICACLPSYIGDGEMKEFSAAFERAGLKPALTSFVDNRVCAFSRFYFDREPEKENLFLIDFGAREIRAGIYAAEPGEGTVNLDCLSSFFSAKLGADVIDAAFTRLFTDIFLEKTGRAEDELSPHTREQLGVFAYQHKDLCFQSNLANSGRLKLYFSFCFPPFEAVVDKKRIDALVGPFRHKFEGFVREVFAKSLKPVSPALISRVICVGGGFETLWARAAVKSIFGPDKAVFFKNSKTVQAEGAGLIAAGGLGAVSLPRISISDFHRIDADIGFEVREAGGGARFAALAERDSFWWWKRPGLVFVLAESTEKPVSVSVCKRSEGGGVSALGALELAGLPKRPKGATRLKLSLEFSGLGSFVVRARDLGFGEMFPASGFEKEYQVDFER